MTKIESKPTGPLQGLIVADFTQLAQGPFATQMLGDMGAEIIKIEPPNGDWMRHYSYGNLYPNDESISFISLNRNKKSIVLDLKTPEGIKAVKEIILKADVVVENFRPGVMERLGIGYEDLKKITPRIIYLGSSGFGADGPYMKRPGQDMLIQSLSGGAFLNGRKGELPVVTAVGQADFLTAHIIVQSILAALYYRETHGKGQKINTNLLSSLVSFYVQEITAFMLRGSTPERSSTGIPNPWVGAPYGMYHTKDGYIAIGMYSVRKLGKLVGLTKFDKEEFETNNVSENRDEIWKDFDGAFRKKSTQEWLNILLPEDVWCSQVNSFNEMINDPQIIHNKMIMEYEHPKAGKVVTTGFPVQFGESPENLYRPAPLLGEHTEDILREYTRLSEAEIDQLKK